MTATYTIKTFQPITPELQSRKSGAYRDKGIH